VFGAEADFQGTTASGSLNAGAGPTISATAKTPWFGTVRGRVGYAMDRILLYATAGTVYGDSSWSGTESTVGNFSSSTSGSRRASFFSLVFFFLSRAGLVVVNSLHRRQNSWTRTSLNDCNSTPRDVAARDVDRGAAIRVLLNSIDAPVILPVDDRQPAAREL